MIDVSSRYLAGAVFQSKLMDEAIDYVELAWFSQFWTLSLVKSDKAFRNETFESFLNRCDIQLRPVPPRPHCKNPIQPKHVTIRSIFFRLRSANPEISDFIHVTRKIRISNNLYGSDTLSSYEMAKGFSKLLYTNQRPTPADDELCAANDKLMEKRKLTLIVNSNTCPPSTFKPGEFDQVCIHDGRAKRGSGLPHVRFCQLVSKQGQSQCKVAPERLSLWQVKIVLQLYQNMIILLRFRNTLMSSTSLLWIRWIQNSNSDLNMHLMMS